MQFLTHIFTKHGSHFSTNDTIFNISCAFYIAVAIVFKYCKRKFNSLSSLNRHDGHIAFNQTRINFPAMK